mmetsp:Transcript_39856/g.89310  ORF Transcript_39856/g.89310 Transcript_39856/m.89310 type:complete len:109 (-) Transcript_39856:64-390(-)
MPVPSLLRAASSLMAAHPTVTSPSGPCRGPSQTACGECGPQAGAGGGGGGGSAAAKDSGPRDSGAKAPGLKVREETKFADSEAPGHAPIGHAPGGAAVRENPLGPSSR